MKTEAKFATRPLLSIASVSRTAKTTYNNQLAAKMIISRVKGERAVWPINASIPKVTRGMQTRHQA